MPWGPSSAPRFSKKITAPKRQAQWSAVANSVLKRTGNEGRAIRSANAVAGRTSKSRPKKARY